MKRILLAVLASLCTHGCLVEWEQTFNNPIDPDSESQVTWKIPGFIDRNNIHVPVSSRLRFGIAHSGSASPDSMRFHVQVGNPNDQQGEFNEFGTVVRETTTVTDGNHCFILFDSLVLGNVFMSNLNSNNWADGVFEARVYFGVLRDNIWYEDRSSYTAIRVFHPLAATLFGSSQPWDILENNGSMGAQPVRTDTLEDLQITNMDAFRGQLMIEEGWQVDSLLWDFDRDGAVDTVTPDVGTARYAFPKGVGTDYAIVDICLRDGHKLRFSYIVHDQSQTPDFGLIGAGGPIPIDDLNIRIPLIEACGDREFQPGSRLSFVVTGRNLKYADRFSWQVKLTPSSGGSISYFDTTVSDTFVFSLDSAGSYNVTVDPLSSDSNVQSNSKSISVNCSNRTYDGSHSAAFHAAAHETLTITTSTGQYEDTLSGPGLEQIVVALCPEIRDSLQITAYLWDLDSDFTVDSSTTDSFLVVRDSAVSGSDTIGIWYELNHGLHRLRDGKLVHRIVREPYSSEQTLVARGSDSAQVNNVLDMRMYGDSLFVLDDTVEAGNIDTLYLKKFFLHSGGTDFSGLKQLVLPGLGTHLCRLGEKGSVYVGESQDTSAAQSNSIYKYDYGSQLISSWGTNGRTAGSGLPGDLTGKFNGVLDVVQVHAGGTMLAADQNTLQFFDASGEFLALHSSHGGPSGTAGNGFWDIMGNKHSIQFYDSNGAKTDTADVFIEIQDAGIDPIVVTDNHLYYCMEVSKTTGFGKMDHQGNVVAVTPFFPSFGSRPSIAVIDGSGNIIFVIDGKIMIFRRL